MKYSTISFYNRKYIYLKSRPRVTKDLNREGAQLRVFESDHSNQCTSQVLCHVVMMKYQMFRWFIHVNHLQNKVEGFTNWKAILGLKAELPQLMLKNIPYLNSVHFKIRYPSTSINTDHHIVLILLLVIQRSRGH